MGECRHWWICEETEKPEAKATCRLCGEQATFKNQKPWFEIKQPTRTWGVQAIRTDLE